MAKIINNLVSNAGSYWYEPVYFNFRNLGSGPAPAIPIEFFTPKLKASVLYGLVVGKIRLKGFNALNTTMQIELSVVGDGTNASVAWGTFNRKIAIQTETEYTITIACPRININAGERIQIKLYYATMEGPIPDNNRIDLYYNAASSGVSGDSYFIFPNFFEEFSPPQNPIFYRKIAGLGSQFSLSRNNQTNGSFMSIIKA